MSRRESNEDMSWEVAKGGLNIMLQHGGTFPDPFLRNCDAHPLVQNDFTIGFYGGEPLLNLKLIEQSIDYIHRNVDPQKKAGFSLTTNGTLLDEDLIEYFIKNNVYITLSLDGPKPIHDNARIYKDGTGSYDDVYRSLLLISKVARKMDLDRPYHIVINVVTTGGYSYQDLYEYFVNLEEILNSRYLNCTISLVSILQGIEKWNEQYPDNPLQPVTGFEDLCEEYKKACIAGVYRDNHSPEWKMIVLRSLVERYVFFDLHGRTRYQCVDEEEIPFNSHPGTICKVGTRRPFMRTDGKILPCERVKYADPYFIIGDYINGIQPAKCVKIIDDFTNLSKDDCKSCWCYRMCSIPCVDEYRKDGELKTDLKQEACEYLRRRRHQELIDMMEMLEVEPAALDHYNKMILG